MDLCLMRECCAFGLDSTAKMKSKERCKTIGTENGSMDQVAYSLPVLTQAVPGCSNHNSAGEAAARDTLVQVMSEAFLKSGSKKSVVRAVCLGVSGVNHPDHQARILNWLRFQANMAAYQNLITKSMYDKQLDSGKGTLLRLCDDVVQQEVSLFLNFFSCVFLLCHLNINLLISFLFLNF
ncbi:hypothetical protein ACET3Z_008937 [Daucus carota]